MSATPVAVVENRPTAVVAAKDAPVPFTFRADNVRLAQAYAAWEPYSGTPADEAGVCFGDIGPLVALADDHGVLPMSLAVHDVGMNRIVLMWCVSEEFWLQIWDGELEDLCLARGRMGAAAVRDLLETLAEIAERECGLIQQSPIFRSLRQAQEALRKAKAGGSNDAVDDAAAAISDEVSELLEQFGA